MSFSEYGNYDGLGLAELVRKKKVTPDGTGGGSHSAHRNAQPEAERRYQ